MKIITSDHGKVKEYFGLVKATKINKKEPSALIGIFAESKDETKGFGFIDTKKESYYINERNTKDAKTGDKVKFKITSKTNDGRKAEATVEEIIKNDAPKADDGKQSNILDQAIAEMEKQAKELGANAVISLKIEQAYQPDGSSKIIVYGTAVTI